MTRSTVKFKKILGYVKILSILFFKCYMKMMKLKRKRREEEEERVLIGKMKKKNSFTIQNAKLH